MKFRFFAMLAGFILMASGALASGWLVEKVGGDVLYAPDGSTWSALSAGQELPNASWVQTRRQGRVLLTRGDERILIRPGTLAAVATWNNRGVNTKVVQRSGAVVLDVEVRARKHLKVETPHLAAVVKGTAFEVTVGGVESSVRVDRGTVDVSDDGGASATRVTAGMQATVAPSRAKGVSVSAAPPAPADAIAEVSERMGPPAHAAARSTGAHGAVRQGRPETTGNSDSRGNGSGNSGGAGSGNSGGAGSGHSGGAGGGHSGGAGGGHSGGAGGGHSGGAGTGETGGAGSGSSGGAGTGNPGGAGTGSSGGGNSDGAGSDSAGGAGTGNSGGAGSGNSGGRGHANVRTDATDAMQDGSEALLLKARI